MSKKKSDTKVVYRDSIEGEFVTQAYAEAHKRTTEKQHVHVPPPKKGGKRAR